MVKSQTAPRIGDTEYLPLKTSHRANLSIRFVSWALLAMSSGACLLAYSGHPSAAPIFLGMVMATLINALWCSIARRAERKLAECGGTMWTSDQGAGLECANLDGWNFAVLMATPFLLWLMPAAPGFRWLFVGFAAVVLFNGILTLIRAAISICKQRYAHASLRLFENASNAEVMVDFVLPPDDVSTRFTIGFEVLAWAGNPKDDEPARVIDVVCTETTRQASSAIAHTFSAVDPRVFAVLGKQAWVHNWPYTATFYLARATLTSEQRAYIFYWD